MWNVLYVIKFVLLFFFYVVVEHQFEVVVEDIRGLSVFGSTVWGETDCFVQYHFPFQRHLESDTQSEGWCLLILDLENSGH